MSPSDTAPDPAAFDFGISFGFDRALFEDDVVGSIAWAEALGAAGVVDLLAVSEHEDVAHLADVRAWGCVQHLNAGACARARLRVIRLRQLCARAAARVWISPIVRPKASN